MRPSQSTDHSILRPDDSGSRGSVATTPRTVSSVDESGGGAAVDLSPGNGPNHTFAGVLTISIPTSAAGAAAAPLLAPGVEESMERLRLAACRDGSCRVGSVRSDEQGWWRAVPGVGCCMPGPVGELHVAGEWDQVGSMEEGLVGTRGWSSCVDLGFGRRAPGALHCSPSGVLSPGCRTSLWSALWGAVRSHTPHSTVKIS